MIKASAMGAAAPAAPVMLKRGASTAPVNISSKVPTPHMRIASAVQEHSLSALSPVWCQFTGLYTPCLLEIMLYLNRFRRGPAITEFDWLSTAHHK